MDNSINSIRNLITNYNNLPEITLEDPSIKSLRFITFDTILEESRNLMYNEDRAPVFCSMGKMANDAINDYSYPTEKSRILLRLHFDGCCKAYENDSNSSYLDELFTNQISFINEIYEDVLSNLYEDAKQREELVSMFGDHFAGPPLTERIQNLEDLFKDFFEYIETKNIGIKVRFKRALDRLGIRNISILRKHYGIDF